MLVQRKTRWSRRLRIIRLASLSLFPLWLLTAAPVDAREYELETGLMLSMEMPSERWEVVRTPPEALVEKIAGGTGPSLLEQTRRKLAANEIFVWNSQSGAYLMIDVSPLKESEEGPSERQLKLSADYAAQALDSEEGLFDVTSQTRATRIEGVRMARKINATYKKGEQQFRFQGIIGYSEPFWIYLYYTDPLRDSRDGDEMDSLLSGLRFHRHKANQAIEIHCKSCSEGEFQ